MKKKKDIAISSSAAEYLTYIAATGDDSQSFEMRYEDENIWLTQKMLAALYDVEIPTINEHIKKIFSDHELEEEATIRNFRILQGVKELHNTKINNEGIIHRDLKPDNIMIDSNHNIKIIDYGLSKIIDFSSITSTGMQIGSPLYMSPEQLKDSCII